MATTATTGFVDAPRFFDQIRSYVPLGINNPLANSFDSTLINGQTISVTPNNMYINPVVYTRDTTATTRDVTYTTTYPGEDRYSSFSVEYVRRLESTNNNLKYENEQLRNKLATFLKSVKTMKELGDDFFGTPQAVVVYMELLTMSALGNTGNH